MNQEEKEFIETINSIDKNLKKSVRKDLKKLMSCIPLLSFLLIPFAPSSFVPILLALGTILSTSLLIIQKVREDKENLKLDKKLEKDLKKMDQFFSKTEKSGKNKVNLSNKKSNGLSNELISCVDIEFFEEYINNLYEFLQENESIDRVKINKEAINQFLNPLYSILGNNVKIIPTANSNADIIIDMLGKNSKKKSALYVHDGNNFYIYIPNKEAIVLLPISNDDMYKIFDSNPKNYDNVFVSQFFSEIYGPFDDQETFNKYK